VQGIFSCPKVTQLNALPFPALQDYWIHTVSADGNGLVFLLDQVNNHVKPQCQHTPPYLLPHLMISLCQCLQQYTHSELGLLMLLPPNFGSLVSVLRPEDVSLDRLSQPNISYLSVMLLSIRETSGHWTVAANAGQTLRASVQHRVETAALLSVQNSH